MRVPTGFGITTQQSDTRIVANNMSEVINVSNEMVHVLNVDANMEDVVLVANSMSTVNAAADDLRSGVTITEAQVITALGYVPYQEGTGLDALDISATTVNAVGEISAPSYNGSGASLTGTTSMNIDGGDANG